MGSLLGNYIHENWENYKIAGTYRVESSWSTYDEEIGQKKSDYDPQIFSQYQTLLKQRAKNTIFTINKKKLKDYENAYNKQLYDEYKALQELTKTNPQDIERLLVKVVENANLGDDIDPQEAIKYIDFDNKGSIKVKTNVASGGIKLAGVSGQKYTLISTIEDRIKTARSRIKLIKNKTTQDLLNEKVDAIEDKIGKAKTEKKSSAYLQREFNIQTSREIKNYEKSIDVEIAKVIIGQLQEITCQASLASALAKLQASFTETMGTIIGERIKGRALVEIISTFSKALGATSTSSNFLNQDKSIAITFDQDMMSAWFDEQANRMPKMQTIEQWQDVTGRFRYDFKVNYSSQSKADFILDYEGYPVGISAKTYDMSKTFSYNKDLPPAVKIHEGTSLYVILYAMEQLQLKKNIANHILNVFSQSPTDTGNLRNLAEDTLVLQLLYSGLSGEMLGKIEGLADILLIEDKSKKLSNEAGAPNRVRFYNITEIINDIADNISNWQTALQITPNLHTLHFTNNKINEDAVKKEKTRAIKQRITKIMNEARSTSMSISINNSYLNDFT